MSTLVLSRRTVLRGLGTLIALPALEAMLPEAKAKSGAPVRTLVFYTPNGLLMDRYRPTGEGADYALSEYLAPLEAFRDDILILSGLENRVAIQDQSEPHSNCTGSILTGQRLDTVRDGPSPPTHNGISMDQVIANAIGAETRYPSLALSSEGAWYPCSDSECDYAWNISWSGPTTPTGKDVYTKSVFQRLFEGADPGESAQAAAARLASKKSVLDYTKDDAARLGARLGKTDSQRLDEYLTGIRDIERRLYSTTSAECNAEAAKIAGDFVQEHVEFPDHVRLMCDLMTLAFECDQTRVITYMMGFGSSSRNYPWLGIYDGHHWLTHHGGDTSMMDRLAVIEKWQIEQFAYLLGKLKAAPDGDGTLLDNCQVLFLNEMGDGNAHAPWDLPVILAGRAGGLITPGRHVAFPDEAPLPNLHLSLIRNAGVELDSFGELGTGPLSDLT
jgi:hypothetical protein